MDKDQEYIFCQRKREALVWILKATVSRRPRSQNHLRSHNER